MYVENIKNVDVRGPYPRPGQQPATAIGEYNISYVNFSAEQAGPVSIYIYIYIYILLGCGAALCIHAWRGAPMGQVTRNHGGYPTQLPPGLTRSLQHSFESEKFVVSNVVTSMFGDQALQASDQDQQSLVAQDTSHVHFIGSRTTTV